MVELEDIKIKYPRDTPHRIGLTKVFFRTGNSPGIEPVRSLRKPKEIIL